MKTLLLPFFICFSLVLYGQQEAAPSPQQVFQSFDRNMNWVELQPQQNTTAARFFQQHYQQFGLERATDMQVVKRTTDQLGWTHHRYQQHFRGIRVEGGTYLLHEYQGQVKKANGHLFRDINVNTSPSWSATQILDKALDAYPAQQYAWENPWSEKTLQRARNNPQATHFPQPELVILDRAYPDESQDYALAYRFIIHREIPVHDRRMLWYDAHSGELLLDVNMMHEVGGEEGTAITRYHGEKEIITMQDTLGNYILRDTTRGKGVETYNDDDRDTLGNRFLFKDDDNFWDNFNPDQDEVAADAHWGAAATYDYFLEYFNYNSYDNEGSPVISNVHVGDRYNNANWNGSAMNFGDGDSIRFYPLTTIDVIAHELVHGVTEFSAGLIYRNESGALNESFSDIFGKAVEAIYMPDDFNWNIGQRFHVNPNGFLRSMADPNLAGDPKYYKGINWYVGLADNGGVHINSGVQNYWYYLLVEGGQGENEEGYAFDIPALGFEKASQIAFRNLTVYLTENSTHEDARRGSLQAAADLFGHCSEEYLAVAEAWLVVGVGIPIVEGDFEIDFDVLPTSGCELEETAIDVIIYNNSCSATLDSGTNIILNYQIDREDVVSEQLNLTNDFVAGGTTTYQFNQLITDPGYGEHRIKVWIEAPGDPVLSNDTIDYFIVNQPFQNEEFSTQERFRPLEGVCSAILARTILPTIRYEGCDTLEDRTSVPYRVKYKDQILNRQYRSNRDIAPLTTITVDESVLMRDFGFGDAEFEIFFPNDPTVENNLAKIYLARVNQTRRAWAEPFENFELDSTRLAIEPAEFSRNAIQEIDNSHRFVATGGNILNESGNLLINNRSSAEEFLFANPEYQTKLHLCLNFLNQNTPSFVFDYQNTISATDWSAYGINPDYASMLMVVINGEPDTLLYGDALSTETQSLRIDMRKYAGEFVELRLIAFALQADIDSTDNSIRLTGDNIILDNLRLDLTSSTSEPTLNSAFTVTPNPTGDHFRLAATDISDWRDLQVRLVDVSGKTLSLQTISNQTNDYSFGHDLSPGIYFLQLTNGTESGYFKLIKQ